MITIEKIVPWEILEQKVREVTLLNSNKAELIYPYEDASIRLERVSYTDVSPTTLYVIRKNLGIQAAIASDLSVAGYHPLELEGGLVLKGEDCEETGFIPPLVEETDSEGKYILDGAHRTSIGRWLGRTHFMAIHVTGIRPDCPGYAFPNSWDEIRIMDEVPSNPADKKHYRGENYRALYRDISALNGSRLRES
jgi:hypothetical protein